MLHRVSSLFSGFPPLILAHIRHITSVWDNCFGTFTYGNGKKYVGEFKDDTYHGPGAFTFAHGEQWRGYYMNGQYLPNICADMGLREGTPQHGQCVLNLMESVLAESE